MIRKRSPLSVYTKLSPNVTKPRSSKVRRLTPHCVAGNLTIEATLNLVRFITRDPVRGASCNYAVGSDGRVGLGVEENNRSWCSSSRTNDHEAITFEIANNGGAPDWRMSDEAINGWMNLAVEICKNYGYTEVKYQTRPSNISNAQTEQWISTWAKPNEMIITLHHWYSATACPGPYFMRQLPWLVKEINKRLAGGASEAFVGEGSNPLAPPVPKPIPTDSISNKPRTNSKIVEEEIWNFFKSNDLNDYAIAGIMGNLFAESNLKSNLLQNSFKTSLGMTDDDYTNGVDNGTYTNFVDDRAGYGLSQWTWYTRKRALLNYAKKSNMSIGDLGMQLCFMWEEMQGYTVMMKELENAKSILDASNVILFNYMKPADQSMAVQARRASYGQRSFDRFSSKSMIFHKPTTDFHPYLIRIATPSLNIRIGPGDHQPVVRTLINDRNVYTIVEEAYGPGSKKGWGRLKSGAGWISLDFIEFVRKV